MQTLDEIRRRVDERKALTGRLKRLLVDRLDLPVDPEWITDDAPILGRGLELDSVDALELAVGLEYDFETSVTEEQIFVLRSVNSVADFIESELGEHLDETLQRLESA